MMAISKTLYILPGIVLVLGILGFVVSHPSLFLAAIGIGLYGVGRNAYESIREGRYSLDYIAFLAMLVSVYAGEYLAGAIVALMFTGGEALEAYAEGSAEGSLKALLERLPKHALVKKSDGSVHEVALAAVEPGAIIVVRPNELIPLDGELLSEGAFLNQANLTGEAFPVSAARSQFVKSGSINVGETLELTVAGTFETSTYARIVDLVRNAKNERAPLVRLSEQANLPFTAITLMLAGIAYVLSEDISRVLAVLVLATPCPLIIAAPVAFIGGLSSGAARNIIIKRAGILETISRATTIFFDKTGTLTLGTPQLRHIEVVSHGWNEEAVLGVAAAIEFHSIHPLARAISAAHTAHVERTGRVLPLHASDVTEMIGRGIVGTVDGITYTIAKAERSYRESAGITLALTTSEHVIAYLHFADVLKNDVSTLIASLTARGLTVAVITGDTQENAEAVFGTMALTIHADASPEDKYRIIDEAKARREVVVMIGDGLNDAPALARSDAGVVFSGTENSAAIEAADAVILGHDVRRVEDLFAIARRSTRIAKESVWTGIGLSIVGMLVAVFGYIPPVFGALLQEGIDVAVILNAVRAAQFESDVQR